MKLFENRLLAEGLRAIEHNATNLLAYIKISEDKHFEALLLERAKNHDQSSFIDDTFAHLKKIIANTFRFLFVMAFIIGGLAVSNVLFADATTSVNFFWAFALFFIPNVFMFILWGLFFLQPQLLQNSSLQRFCLMLIRQFEGYFNKASIKQNNYKPLFSCYFNIHFGKTLGRYQLSQLTHLIWLGYFCGATLMSILMLATHQVDFIWQTSILSSDTFQTLTNLLAYLPQKLALPVPTIEQIQQSFFTTDNLAEAESRRLAWSSLLISSLFLYGLLPRLLLFLLMHRLLKNKKRNYQLDLGLAYYVRLRQMLKPNKTTLGVIDADSEAIFEQVKVASKVNNCKKTVLKENYFPIAVELSEQQFDLAKQHLQRHHSQYFNQLVNVCDYHSQQSIIASLQQNKSTEVAIYVSVNRLPDRGLKRFIRELTASTDKTISLLLIIENHTQQQRDTDWYQLADSVGIELDNIIHIEVEDAQHG